jgi:hypothetical protein
LNGCAGDGLALSDEVRALLAELVRGLGCDGGTPKGRGLSPAAARAIAAEADDRLRREAEAEATRGRGAARR